MRETPFPPRHQPLKRDVSVLGSLLGEVLVEQGGQELFDTVESARLAAQDRRAGVDGAADRLADILHGLSPFAAEQVVRAFGAYFTLVNLAEQVHRIRRRRVYLADPENPQEGSLRAVFLGLKANGIDAETARHALLTLWVQPVFTAHPTEAIRRTLLTKHQRIARALVDRLDASLLTPGEEAAALGRVREEITTAWQTEEHLSVRPSVADEVEHATFYLSDVIYRIVPAFYREIEASFAAVYGAPAKLTGPIVRFASWVGGDMDGNPNVGPETILATLRRHREILLRKYREEVHDLFDRLSHSGVRARISSEVSGRIEEYRRRWPKIHEDIAVRYRDMPYRVLLWYIHARLEGAIGDREHGYEGADDFAADLSLLSRSLLGNSGAHAGRFRVERLLRRVETFGFHLASLDIRQDARVHRRAVGELLKRPDFADLPAKERVDLIVGALGDPSALADRGLSAETVRVLDCLKALEECRRRYGPSSVGPCIVSMTEGADDALAVLLLARVAGLGSLTGPAPIDVVPLFEKPDDLRAAADTLHALLSAPAYAAHVADRGGRQQVMLGFSDSSKEGGIAASRVLIHRATQELLARACEHGVRLTFFLGRGGTISRGGGKIRDAILAAPEGAAAGGLRVTEQGEIVHARYGLRDIAERTLELMTGALLEATLGGARSVSRDEWPEAATLLANSSERAWRSLVYEDPEFFSYFQAATPIDVIERMNIGSRPAFRKEASGIEDLRAIPWVFAWTQSRQVLPGWYGVGTGLAAACERFGFRSLRRMARDWPFFRNLLSDVAMVLAKADLGIARRYAALAGPVGERIFPRIEEEFRRTRDLVVSLQGARGLLEREDLLGRAIALRNPYVDPMSLVQVDLLSRWREGGRVDDALQTALFTTVQGIARGLQNTG
jgi:phosphoenolpyruvate carboxylase